MKAKVGEDMLCGFCGEAVTHAVYLPRKKYKTDWWSDVTTFRTVHYTITITIGSNNNVVCVCVCSLGTTVHENAK